MYNQSRHMGSQRGGGAGSVSGGMNNSFMAPSFDITRTHSINLITEEFLGGYMQDGRMSVVRRFFCLFVTFDLVFVSLLWLICIMINGDNIFHAFQQQILHYSIYKSLFDVVAAAICRFLVLIIFYAMFYVNHWSIVALSTSGSCLFLISKVFVFDWVNSAQQAFEVILIITSFVIAWGEAWFLDCRVIPQERHASRYFSDISTTSDRSPMLAPFLASQPEHNVPESVANFYSPLDSAQNSDEEDELDEEYHKMGLDCVRKAYELLENSEWKVEKVTSKGDTIRSTQREKLGKVYRLTAHIKYPAKALLEELFYKIEDIPKWNPTLLESKLVHKINSYTDIAYNATIGGGGGIVKSRDFVNLRCWRLFRNGKLIDDPDAYNDDEDDGVSSDEENILSRSCEGSVTTISESGGSIMPSSVESGRNKLPYETSTKSPAVFETLSKSLGAKDFNTAATVLRIEPDEPPPFEDEYVDASDHMEESMTHMPTTPTKSAPASLKMQKDVVWVSAAISIDFKPVPPTTKYIRGENLVSGFALREIDGKTDACIFEWLICLDLKGYIPRYVLENTYTSFMNDYMTHMRKYIRELRQKRKQVPRK